MKTADVVICELGLLSVERGGTSTTVTGSRAPTVLALLALRRHRGCRTSELVEWSWPPPGQPPTARRSLANVIARLRSLAGAAAIETTEDGYRLADGVGSNRQQFLDLTRESEGKLLAGEVQAAAEMAAAGARLWRDTPWAGIDGVDAIDADRSLLAGARGRLLTVQAESAHLMGNRQHAVAIWEQLLLDEPYHEHGWGQLAKAYLSEGRRTDGLRVLQRARQSLAQVGLLPCAELLLIERMLLGVDDPVGSGRAPELGDGSTGERKIAKAVEQEPVGGIGKGSQLAVDRSIPFVGRTDEMAVVLAFLDRAAASHGLLISGAPGAGKTRLLVECLRRRPEILVLAGRAEAEPSGLLGPLADLLLDHRDLLPEDHVIALQALVPGLDPLGRSSDGGAVNQAARPLEPAYAAALASSAIRHVVRRLPAQVVVVIDDLQWVTPVVFTVLMRLLSSTALDGPVFVATHRSLPPDLAGDTAGRVAELRVLPTVEAIDLGPLTQSDVAALADSGGYGGDVAALHAATGGNALFVTESVRSNELGAVSQPLRVLIRSRVEHVHQGALRFLELASLCGTEFRTDLVIRTLGLALADADRLVDALYDAGILLPVNGAPERARFTHALVADALAAPLGRRRRQHLHLDLATAFRDAGQPPTRWVGHLVAAGSLVEGSTMMAAVEMAVDSFNRQQDHGAVAELCRKALALELPEPQAAAIQIELGRSLMRLSIADEGRLELATVAETARRLRDPFLMAEAALAYSAGGAWTSNADELGPALLREALKMLTSTDDFASAWPQSAEDATVLLARLEARLGGWNIFTASLEERDQATVAVLDMVRRSGDDVALLDALNARHIAVSCPAALAQTLVVEAELEELGVTGRGSSELANSPMPGTYWAADGYRYNQGIDRRLARPNSDLDPVTRFLSAVRANYGGDTAAARRHAEQGLGLRDSDVGRGNHLWLNVVADWIDGAAGRSRDLADQRLAQLGGAPLRCTAMWTLAAAGDLDGAKELRERLSKRSVARLPELFLGGFGLGSATMAAVALDDDELGTDLAAALEPYRHQMFGVPWASYPCGAFFLGVIEATWGEAGRAARQFEVAAEIHRRMGADSFIALASPWSG